MFGLSPYTINKFTTRLEITVTRWSRYNLDIEISDYNRVTLTEEAQANNLSIVCTIVDGDITYTVTTYNNLDITDINNVLNIVVESLNNLEMSAPLRNNITYQVDTYNNLVFILYYNRVALEETKQKHELDYEVEQLRNTMEMYVEGAEIDGNV